MIPLGDVIPVRTRPFVAIALMVGTVVTGGPLLRIGANVMALWIFGRTVEDRLGHARFIAFVTLCAIAGAASQRMADAWAGVLAAGIAAAVAAVLGGYFLLYPYSKVLVLIPAGLTLRIVELPAAVFLTLWYALQVASLLGGAAALTASPVPGLIPSWAHLTGFAAGALTVRLFLQRERLRVEWWNNVQER